MHWIDTKLKTLAPLLGERKTGLLRQAYLFEDDPRGKKAIENHIDILVAKHVKPTFEDRIILPPAIGNTPKGSINLGKISYLDREIAPYQISRKSLTRHAGIFGSTGTGKTTFAAKIIDTLYNSDIPFLIIDWEKSYRYLLKKYPDVEVFTVGKNINPLNFNMLDIPPGVETEEHIKSLINLIAEDYLSGAGSDTMILNYMKLAYQEHENPTFRTLKEIVIREIQNDMKGKGKLAGRSGLWKETVQRIITFISCGAINNVFGTNKHYPIDKLLKGKVVLELGSIQSERDRKFIIHYILNWIFLALQERGISHENLRQVIFLEEFHNIALKAKHDNLISSMFRQCRKYGLGLIAMDQTPSEIPNSIFANMNLLASFNLNTEPDRKAATGALNLKRFDKDFIGMLSTGEAIAIQKQTQHEPILLKADYIDIDHPMTDDELKHHIQCSDKGDSIQHEFVNQSKVQTVQRTDTLPPLTVIHKILLQTIAEKPHIGTRERIKLMGIHPSEMATLVQDLTSRRLIKADNVDRKKILSLTEQGKLKAINEGIKVPKNKSKGGSEHNYYVNETRQFLKKQGMQPVLEYQNYDIAVPDKGILIEIETGKSTVVENLLKLNNSSNTTNFMLTTNKATELKLNKIAQGFKNVRTMHAKDFLKLNCKEILNSSG